MQVAKNPQSLSQVTNTQLDITLPRNSAAQTINYSCIKKKKKKPMHKKNPTNKD